MRASNTRTRARYSDENMVAYQDGNAAKMPAPATISQTSFPSQNGPMEFMAARFSSSVFPTIPCSMPTPKSNPSRTKNPAPQFRDQYEP